MLLMNLESRPVVFEDIGRQLLAHGHYKAPTEYLKKIGMQQIGIYIYKSKQFNNSIYIFIFNRNCNRERYRVPRKNHAADQAIVSCTWRHYENPCIR